MNVGYQLKKLRRGLRKVRDGERRERLMIVKAYYEEGSLRKAAEQCGCSHGKVKYWKQRYEEEGLRGLNTEAKSGAPPKIEAEKANEIRKDLVKLVTKEEGWQTKQIREYIREATGVSYSIRHTMRIAQSWGMGQVAPRPQYVYANKKEKMAFLKGKH